ncbi:hypothetical protein ES708_32170 [subsurface metagenome]
MRAQPAKRGSARGVKAKMILPPERRETKGRGDKGLNEILRQDDLSVAGGKSDKEKGDTRGLANLEHVV